MFVVAKDEIQAPAEGTAVGKLPQGFRRGDAVQNHRQVWRLEPELIELDSFLADTMRLVVARTDEKRLALNAEIEPSIRLHADRRTIKQIVINLMSNAVKFTPDGGRVTVRARVIGSHVNLAIEDTGIGIPKEALKNLGKPFEQVENQLTKTHRGSGLGLAIAKSLTELNGGAMRIRSALGVGTIVLVRLPVGAAPLTHFVELQSETVA